MKLFSSNRFLLWSLILILNGIFTMAAQARELHIALIGASIAREWNVPELSQRMNLSNTKFEFVGVFDQFDATGAIKEIIARKEKPDVVIIKQCSVYFPGPLAQYKKLTTEWVKELQQADIRPVLATVIPIAKADSVMDKAKDLIRVYVMHREPKMDQIENYNGWVHQFSESQGLPVLDLEKAMRISASDPYMRPEFNKGDRVHINHRAYLALDAIIPPFVNETRSAEKTAEKNKSIL